jgi:hypothetical protein
MTRGTCKSWRRQVHRYSVTFLQSRNDAPDLYCFGLKIFIFCQTSSENLCNYLDTNCYHQNVSKYRPAHHFSCKMRRPTYLTMSLCISYLGVTSRDGLPLMFVHSLWGSDRAWFPVVARTSHRRLSLDLAWSVLLGAGRRTWPESRRQFSFRGEDRSGPLLTQMNENE